MQLDIDLYQSPSIINKCNNPVYAQNLYAALCNNTFFKNNQEWSCSWRMSASIVANLRNSKENYTDWYCSGIMVKTEGYVEENFITEEIAMDLFRLGWSVKPEEE